MKYIDFTFKDPASNLAFDEVLLNEVESGAEKGFLRFWESTAYFVVVGHGNRIQLEVDQEQCKSLGIPILRRVTGGGTVLQGPGCLNYALAVPIVHHPDFHSVTSTNRKVMESHARLLQSLTGKSPVVRGVTDIVLDGRKCSGNAQRRRQRSLLFHGTFLLDMDMEMIERTLLMPSREPDYRAGRPHSEFLAPLQSITRESIRTALMRLWESETLGYLDSNMRASVETLAQEKYNQESWNYKFP